MLVDLQLSKKIRFILITDNQHFEKRKYEQNSKVFKQ